MVDENTSKKDLYKTNSIQAYYDIVMQEYGVERDKKNSFDTRAGIILGFLGILAGYMFKDIKITKIFKVLGEPPQLFPFIKDILLIVIIVTFFVSLYYSIKVLNIEAYQGYKISKITKRNLLDKNSIFTKAELTMDYKEVVMSYRTNNALKAKYLNKSILFIGILIVSMFIKQSIQ